MRAYVWSAEEGRLSLEEVDEPHPLAGEVALKVAACGLCQTDLHVMSGGVPFPSPCVLGHEVAGTVDEVGAGVAHVKPGDRVVAGFIMPCGDCRRCKAGEDDQCELFLTLNRRRGVLYNGTSRLSSSRRGQIAQYSMGGLAERCVLPAAAVCPIPITMPFESAATLGCSGLTALGAVQNAGQIRAGQSVAVIGAGGVGLNVIQLARLFGAGPIVAVDIDPKKLALASHFGATHTIDARLPDAVSQIRQATPHGGVDVCFDAFGSAATVETAIGAVQDGGRVVVVGVGATSPAQVDVLSLVRRKLQIVGSFGGRTRQDLPTLVQFVTDGRLDVDSLVTNRYSFHDVDQAVADLRNHQVAGRAVISMP
ncbi:S-(hydroxymethyl)mycothiol dehydrogenase [Frondihabitans sp. 762G35]|uniref:zinc-binding dehydrogenase n=1 Tax=Frondihabitans sp. 762G35 TaxID=1446794 RepID=UPI000D20026C|nr:zinc-binding dehydrogenase [Frondihabitans sp. 762G35]ARC58629.1 S-(hydroxymethyl)mycothiol dehydrogenase [Frondihabitans sp. 762G35]